MQIQIRNRCSDFNSYRAARVKSLFSAESGCNFDLDADMDLSGEWSIGVVVGPSGSGKTSIGRQIFGEPAPFWTPELLKVVGLFGGVGAIVVALAAFASKWMADRSIERHKAELGRETEKLKGELAKETETHKLILKKREILFQKEIEAASAFIALHRTIEPKYNHPDMDWDEAMADVAKDFRKVAAQIRGEVWSSTKPATSKRNRQLHGVGI
jgi:hypothetical protein